MKDLKHYFVSPKGSPTECDLVSRDSTLFGQATVSNSSSSKDTCSANGIVIGSSKKTKRKRKESGDFVEKPVDSGNIALNVKVSKVSKENPKKRGKSDVVLKTIRGVPDSLLEIPVDEISINDFSELKSNGVLTDAKLNCNTKCLRKSSRKIRSNTRYSDFSDVPCIQDKSNDSLSETLTNEIVNSSVTKNETIKDQMLCVSSEIEEKDCSTPENTKNLFNYFNKVDKLPEIEKRPHIIKVEAMVHVPSSSSSEVLTPKSTKKKKSVKKQVLEVDYDLITLEGTDVIEINSTPSSKAWKMRIQVPDEPRTSAEYEGKTLKTLKEEMLEEEMLTRLSKNRDDILNKNEKKKRKLRKSIEDKVDISNNDERKKRKLEPELSDRSSPKKNPNENKEDVSSKHDRRKRKLEPDLLVSILPKKKPPALKECEVEFVSETKKEKYRVKNDGTLASFFQIGSRKLPAMTSEQKLAKKAFLNSGAPELIKRITDIKHNNDFQGKVAPYPVKSHVQQKDRMNIMWNLAPTKLNFVDDDKIVMNLKWSSILPNQLQFEEQPVNELQASNATSLSSLKKELNLYPISCWSKELKRLKKGKDNLIWTERYRPHLASTFLANTRSISKLKAWLTELKENSRTDSGDSSGDEFIKDDDQKSTERKTVILLSGLPGTGKTAAVYAIAEEIGYHVLEINASYNRSGKRILNKFSEAMQSHKVGVSKLNLSKVKKKSEHPKRSLVLVEDADLLFEDDEGFVPTLINLAAGTKRPMILVVNNSRTKHLSKLTAVCHASLHFTPPSQDRLESWLRTISAVEGFSLNEIAAAELAYTQDIRRSLLQLQFSKEKVSLDRCGDLEESIWKHVGECNFDSAKEREKAKVHMSSLATLDIIRQNKKSNGVYSPPYWQSLPEDSTSAEECYELPGVDCLDDYESYFLKLMNVRPKLSRFQQFENPRNLNDIENTAFSLTNILSRRNNAIDFWPSIRQISRNEASRLASHTKRNNRYFSYLSSIGISGPADVIQSLSLPFKNLS